MNEMPFARMFLAATRRVEQDHLFRTIETVRQNDPSDPSATGLLRMFRDETLAPGHSLSFTASEKIWLFLFPIAGSLTLNVDGDDDEPVCVGETLLTVIEKGTSFTISNNGSTLINYAHGWIAVTGEPPASGVPHIDLRRFDGREEINYRLHEKTNRVFVWVVQGAFEVKNRLLESRDGMILCGLGDIDAEALSNEAILLMIEYP